MIKRKLNPVKKEKKINVISIQEYNSIIYSERNKKEKEAPEYSVLKPETSSDSASLKSKGARWVSAKVQIIHTGRIKRKRIDEKLEKERTL